MTAKFNLDPTVGNTRRPSFKTGTQFKPSRPAIRDFLPKPAPTKRDTRFDRPAFIKSSPTPRGLKSIADIERLKTKQEGIKVRLGDASLGKIKIKKRDKLGKVITDAAGQPVFEEVTLNFGLLAQILEGSFAQNMEKLKELATAIRTGATTSQADRDAFTIAIARIMSTQENVARLSATQLDFITRSLQLLGISKDPMQAGIRDLVDGRFVTEFTWTAGDGRNIGPIILFLIANVRENPLLTPGKPIIGRNGRAVKIAGLFPVMAGSSRQDPLVIDLIGKQLYNTLQQAREGSPVRPAGFAPFGTEVGLPLVAQRPAIQGEFEDSQGAFRIVGALDPAAFVLPRAEGEESMLERLARQSTERELEAQSQLVEFKAPPVEGAFEGEFGAALRTGTQQQAAARLGTPQFDASKLSPEALRRLITQARTGT